MLVTIGPAHSLLMIGGKANERHSPALKGAPIYRAARGLFRPTRDGQETGH